MTGSIKQLTSARHAQRYRLSQDKVNTSLAVVMQYDKMERMRHLENRKTGIREHWVIWN